ncbi:IS110 family transposase [Mucilaginibacter sp. SMC90]|uniref:IS110 family transposase n=1 Tax=Mucilaginibacter sp. SMC90 TaxID=2929803 RepID=UPI001FB5030B|nr:IS110 family transposase [Mucilaginibacter sp. SMC90]UOE51374.1 IS110 family transposase [Mucilaginibacter sp. SMC90]
MDQPRQEVSLLPQLNKACGLDMHKDKIVGFISNKDGKEQELQEFGTFTCQLHQIKEWLLKNEVGHCLMESTGIYWISLYTILTEAGINVTVANPVHIKQIPKRKTDRKDARWLCTLLLHGLTRPSFIPDSQQCALRDYCRSRLFYGRQQTKITNRILKILESNNIKLMSVISTLHTKTGLNIVRLLAAEVTDKALLCSCAKGRVKAKKEQLMMALEGTLTTHHCMQLRMLLEDYDHVQKQVDLLDAAISAIISERYARAVECLDSISGIGMKSAEVIISEAGDDMTRFPSADHFTAWCGVAPGNNESAGRHKNVTVKKGNTYLRVAIVTAAWAAVKMKNSYWHALFDKLRKRMKAQKAIIAIARRLLKVAYKTIQSLNLYEEKGIAHFLDIQTRNMQYIRYKANK